MQRQGINEWRSQESETIYYERQIQESEQRIQELERQIQESEQRIQELELRCKKLLQMSIVEDKMKVNTLSIEIFPRQ
jgi:predicted RNase H-like nuclease (RuvC/YqgF family)